MASIPIDINASLTKIAWVENKIAPRRIMMKPNINVDDCLFSIIIKHLH